MTTTFLPGRGYLTHQLFILLDLKKPWTLPLKKTRKLNFTTEENLSWLAHSKGRAPLASRAPWPCSGFCRQNQVPRSCCFGRDCIMLTHSSGELNQAQPAIITFSCEWHKNWKVSLAWDMLEQKVEKWKEISFWNHKICLSVSVLKKKEVVTIN